MLKSCRQTVKHRTDNKGYLLVVYYSASDIIIIIIIIIINVEIIVTLLQKNAAGALYKTLCQNLQLMLCNK